jgi:hypothetical protein
VGPGWGRFVAPGGRGDDDVAEGQGRGLYGQSHEAIELQAAATWATTVGPGPERRASGTQLRCR